MDPSECSSDSAEEASIEPAERGARGSGPETIGQQLSLDPNISRTPPPPEPVVAYANPQLPQRPGQSPPPPPDVHLVIAGIAKRPNVVALLQLAVAFGVRTVLVVGQGRNLADLSALPAVLRQLLLQEEASTHGSTDEEDDSSVQPRLKLIRFRKWPNVVEYLLEQNIPLVGVEIHPRALSVLELLEKYFGARHHDHDGESTAHDEHIGVRSFALVMGNEGDGLSPTQMDACTDFVRIPQFGTGTASLNVAVAASIVLHQCHTYRMTLLGEDDDDDGDSEGEPEANSNGNDQA